MELTVEASFVTLVAPIPNVMRVVENGGFREILRHSADGKREGE